MSSPPPPPIPKISSLRNLTNQKEERIAVAVSAASGGGGFARSVVGAGSSGTVSPNTIASADVSIGSGSNRSFSVRSDPLRAGSTSTRGVCVRRQTKFCLFDFCFFCLFVCLFVVFCLLLLLLFVCLIVLTSKDCSSSKNLDRGKKNTTRITEGAII